MAGWMAVGIPRPSSATVTQPVSRSTETSTLAGLARLDLVDRVVEDLVDQVVEPPHARGADVHARGACARARGPPGPVFLGDGEEEEEVEVEASKKGKERQPTSNSIERKKNSSLTFPSHPNFPTWIWSAPYALSSRGKLGDVAAALEVTKGRERHREGEREAATRRWGASEDIAAVAAIDDDGEEDDSNAAVLPALLLALTRQAAASERIAAATTRRDAGRASSALWGRRGAIEKRACSETKKKIKSGAGADFLTAA